MNAEIPQSLMEPLDLLEPFINGYLAEIGLPNNLQEAVQYALLAGGKRLRPLLTLHWCTAAGGTFEQALPAAAAIEMIHAFSLVHDDLPALDNDDMRRGRPTTHKAFGEAMAILAGDALMSLPFQLISDRVKPARSGTLVRELAAGTTAMIAGQVLDTLGGFPESTDDRKRLRSIHANKTGALITRACRMGALSAAADGAAFESESDANALRAATVYGGSIGLMFQIVDDLLDVEQTAEHTGKRTAKDAEAGKLTYPSVYGAEASRDEIRRLRDAAFESVEVFGAQAEPLRLICEYLAVRTR